MTDDTINKTKRKLIMQDVARMRISVVSHDTMLALCNRYQLKYLPVRNLLTSVGYSVEAVPEKPAPTPKPKALDPVPSGIPPEVINTILRGGIYKKLDDDPGADPSTVFVVTTLDKFLKEREAIRKLLQHLQPKGA